MRLTLRILLLVACAAVLGCSCSHTPDPIDNRPGSGGDVPVSAEHDYSAEKADTRVRAVAGGHILDADATGVLYMTDEENYTYVDLDNGSRVDFSPAQPRLAVDGIEREVTAVNHFHSTATRHWWAVATPSDTAIIVTSTNM